MNITFDVHDIEELVQETIVENYIAYATLAVIVYDIG